MFGVAVHRDGRMYFVSYFDRGRDSAEAGRAFVESFAIVLAATPSPAAGEGDPSASPTPTRTEGVAIGDALAVALPVGVVPEWATGIRHGSAPVVARRWTATRCASTPASFRRLRVRRRCGCRAGRPDRHPGATGISGEATTAGTYWRCASATAADGHRSPGRRAAPRSTAYGLLHRRRQRQPGQLAAFLAVGDPVATVEQHAQPRGWGYRPALDRLHDRRRPGRRLPRRRALEAAGSSASTSSSCSRRFSSPTC